MKYTITTDLIKNIKPKEILSILYPLINDECNDSIVLDKDLKLLDIYYKHSSHPELISSWIKYLSDSNCYTPIQYSFDPETFSDKDIILLTNKVKGGTKMIVYSLESLDYADEVKTENESNIVVLGSIKIPVIECNEARRAINATTIKIQQPNNNEPKETEPNSPMTEDDIYQAILTNINNIGKNIERYPKTIENQDEETIRNLLLTQLSTSFPLYSSTGESFNHEGKTDIMVKYGNDILFIAECKFWKGQKKLLEAIHQILRYLTWRDTKTALVIFNKDTDIQTVIQSIQASIPNHPNFSKLIQQRDSGWYDYSFHITNSSNVIKMAVMVFNFYKKGD